MSETQDERFARYQWVGDAVWHTQREEREAEEKRLAEFDDDVYVDRSELKPTKAELDAGLFNYELSAYSDKVGYYADGIQRVSPIRR